MLIFKIPHLETPRLQMAVFQMRITVAFGPRVAGSRIGSRGRSRTGSGLNLELALELGLELDLELDLELQKESNKI